VKCPPIQKGECC